MSLKVTCVCGKTYRVKEEMEGRKIRCKECGEAVTITVPQEEDGADDPEPEEQEAFSTIESPITRLVDQVLDRFRFFDHSLGRFQSMQRRAARAGVYGILMMAAGLFLNNVIERSGFAAEHLI